MTRSFGDFYLKYKEDVPIEAQAVIAVPDVVVRPRSHNDEFLVLACDGIFDVMSNQDVVDCIATKLGYTGTIIYTLTFVSMSILFCPFKKSKSNLKHSVLLYLLMSGVC